MAGIGLPANLQSLFIRLVWESRRRYEQLAWRFGVQGIVAAVCVGVAIIALSFMQTQESALRRLQKEIAGAARREVPLQTTRETLAHGGAERLHDFDAFLLPHNDIPSVIKRLVSRAEIMGVNLARGEYKAQQDMQGGFLRYGMVLPMKGDAAAIHGFILAALLENPTLALEEIQFKRERAETEEMEARVRWVVFARLPEAKERDEDKSTPSTRSMSEETE